MTSRKQPAKKEVRKSKRPKNQTSLLEHTHSRLGQQIIGIKRSFHVSITALELKREVHNLKEKGTYTLRSLDFPIQPPLAKVPQCQSLDEQIARIKAKLMASLKVDPKPREPAKKPAVQIPLRTDEEMLSPQPPQNQLQSQPATSYNKQQFDLLLSGMGVYTSLEMKATFDYKRDYNIEFQKVSFLGPPESRLVHIDVASGLVYSITTEHCEIKTIQRIQVKKAAQAPRQYQRKQASQEALIHEQVAVHKLGTSYAHLKTILDSNVNPKALIPKYSETQMITTLHYTESRAQQIIITRREWDKLNPHEYLNDTLVLFWLKFLQHYCFPTGREGAPGQTTRNIYIFDPQFYTKVSDCGYSAVRRWTKKVDLFAKEHLFLPICHEDHWSLCVVVNPAKVVDLLNKKIADAKKQAKSAQSPQLGGDPIEDEPADEPSDLPLEESEEQPVAKKPIECLDLDSSNNELNGGGGGRFLSMNMPLSDMSEGDEDDVEDDEMQEYGDEEDVDDEMLDDMHENMESDMADDYRGMDQEHSGFYGPNQGDYGSEFGYGQMGAGYAQPQPSVADDSKCYILNFDSMLPLNAHRMQELRNYLLQECIDKKVAPQDQPLLQSTVLTAADIPAYHPNVPKQQNGTDCGLFLLEYVEGFLGKPESVTSDLNQEKTALFNRRLVDEKREHIRRVIVAMAESKTCKDLGEGYMKFRAGLDRKLTRYDIKPPSDKNNSSN